MNELITQEKIDKAKRDKKVFLAIFFVVTALYLAAVITLLLLSSRDFLVYLLINILLTVAYGFAYIYLFATRFASVKAICKFYEGLASAQPEKALVTFLKYEEESHQKDGIDFCSFLVEECKDGESYERQILCFPAERKEFSNGQKLIITVYCGVMIAYEEKQ